MRARALTAVVTAVFLVSCQQGPTEEQMAGQGNDPLSGEEIRKTLVGNSTHETGHSSGGRYQFAAYFMEGGQARGRAWWSGGQQEGTGRWRIDGNLWCERWNPDKWGGGREICQKVYKDGNQVSFIVVSGSGDNDTVTLKKGNAYDL